MADSSTYTPETLQRRYAMAQALLADPKTPIVHWAQGLNELAKGALGGRMLGEADRQQIEGEKGAQAARLSLLGVGDAAPAIPASPAAAPLPAAPVAPAGVPDRIVGAESGGDPTAVNPRSTAAGPGQFIDSTWLETLKKTRPDLAAGKDDATLLAMRTDPAQAPLSREMTDAYAKQNAGTLSAAGQPVTPGTTYLAHFAGPGGATKILGADPATPVTALLSPAAIKANPHIANMTAGDLRAWADKKMGGGAQSPAVVGNTGVAAVPDANGVFGPDANVVSPPPPAVSAIASALNSGPSSAPTSAAPTAPLGAAPVAAALNAPPVPPVPGPSGDAKARIAAMLRDPNPYVRKQGGALADALIQKNLLKEDPKFHRLNDEQLFDEKTGKTIGAGSGFKALVDPAERAAHGIPADDKRPYQVGPGNKLINPPAETRVSMNTVANPIIEGVGKQFVESRKAADTAVTGIQQIHDARRALDQGAITGAGADIRTTIQKVGGLIGLSTEQAANTEVFRSAVGNQVLSHIKALGANPSNADRDYIEKVMGGQVAMEEKSLRKVLDISEKYSRQSIKNFNRDSERITKANPEAYKSIEGLMNIQEPGEYAAPAAPVAAPTGGAPTAAPTAAPAGDGWTDISPGIRIRERK